MSKLIGTVLLLVSLASPAWAAETVLLTTPKTYPSQTTWAVDGFTVSVHNASIEFVLIGNNNEQLRVLYTTPPPASNPSQPSGATLINALNTANFSSSSLVRAIFNRLITDGYITGTVQGTP